MTTTTRDASRTNRRRGGLRAASRGTRLLTHVLLIISCAIWILPVVGAVVTSFLPNTFSIAQGWWRAFLRPSFISYNYRNLAATLDLPGLVFSSLVLAVPVTIIGLLLAATAAYALAWLDVPGRLYVLMGIVALQVVPPQITLSPLLTVLNAVGIGNTVAAVWILQVGLSIPFGVMVLHSAFAALPQELIEASRIDGASAMTTFSKVVLPVSGGSLAGVAVIFFLWGWNELLGPLVFLGASSSSANFTLVIADMAGGDTLDQNLLVAAALVSIVVPLLVFFLLQRFFVRGIMGGSVKG